MDTKKREKDGTYTSAGRYSVSVTTIKCWIRLYKSWGIEGLTPDAKPLFHSDREFQYNTKVFKTKLDKQGMIQSMSRVGRCIDNGPMEAFWGTLKAEMYYLRRFSDYNSLKAAIKQYISFYNSNRYQEKLGRLAPLEYRALLQMAV